MFKVKILTIGKIKEGWLLAALQEYQKRLTSTLTIEWVIPNTEQELQKLALKEPALIALDIQGELLSSEKWSLALFSTWGLKPTFIIGGADGLDPAVLRHAKIKVSLSPLTFTHQMVRLILIEQLYRALQIEQGGKYHK
jgi:23S rRNA (pseudouridine1915-N3)-methyltransferase